MKKILGLFGMMLVAGCAITTVATLYAPITADEQFLIDNPPPALLAAIERKLPESRKRTLEAEAIALKNGRPLSDFERELAVKVGVKNPDKIRILVTDKFPIDEERAVGPHSVAIGLTMRYGVFIKSYVPADPAKYYEVVAHEFVHVRQFEQFGIDGMTRRFIVESVVLGDKLIPVEREAVTIGNRAFDDPKTVYGL
jgi:hypothetical protein